MARREMNRTTDRFVARLLAQMNHDGLLSEGAYGELVDALEAANGRYGDQARSAGDRRLRNRANLAGWLSEMLIEERAELEGESV